jgi:DNA-binding NarL/FixJ family response regulator
MRIVVATHSREVRMALFLALDAVPTATIAATATTTAELMSHCRAFQPDAAVVEDTLPGQPVGEALTSLSASHPDCRFFVVDTLDGPKFDAASNRIETFTDVDQLVAAVPESGAEAS